jgi:DNA-binding PadR family transcriptional regulator
MANKPDIETIVLGALRNGPLHGYRIAQTIRARSEGMLKMGDNQIYPTLHRLEMEGLVKAEWQIQEGKPSRKVYALAQPGIERLTEKRREWERFSRMFSAVIGGPEVSGA